MEILFAHNVPKKLRLQLPGHLIRTAKEMDWAEFENGNLLRAAEAEGFQLMLTCDQDLSYQQNLIGRKLGLIVLSTNNWNMLKSHIEQIVDAIALSVAGSFAYIQISK